MRKITSLLLACLLALSVPASALASEYDVAVLADDYEYSEDDLMKYSSMSLRGLQTGAEGGGGMASVSSYSGYPVRLAGSAVSGYTEGFVVWMYFPSSAALPLGSTVTVNFTVQVANCNSLSLTAGLFGDLNSALDNPLRTTGTFSGNTGTFENSSGGTTSYYSGSMTYYLNGSNYYPLTFMEFATDSFTYVSFTVNGIYLVTPEKEELGLLGQIVDAITSLPTLLLDGIKSLFIPSDDYFDTLVSEEQELFSEHLGVLYQAWESFSGVSEHLNENQVVSGLDGTGLDTTYIDYAANNPGSFKFPALSFEIQGENYTLWDEQIVSMDDYLGQWKLAWIPTLTKMLSGFAISLGFLAWCLKFLYDQFGWQACLTGYNMITTFGGLFRGKGEET